MSFMAEYGAKLAGWWGAMSGRELTWLGIGLFGQSLFVFRWIIQWWSSERAGRLVVPDVFWYCSLIGGVLVMAYGLQKPDPVIVLGQFGVIIYGRNLYFIMKKRRADEAAGFAAVDTASRPQGAA